MSELLDFMEADGKLATLALAKWVLLPRLEATMSGFVEEQARWPYLRQVVADCQAHSCYRPAVTKSEGVKSTVAGKGGKKEKSKNNANAAPTGLFSTADVVKPVLGEIDWASAGLVRRILDSRIVHVIFYLYIFCFILIFWQMSSLCILFDAAILAAFPCSKELQLHTAAITRCANPAFGDFQCNNAMALSKGLKSLEGYSGTFCLLLSYSFDR
jgi:hypothetical protein